MAALLGDEMPRGTAEHVPAFACVGRLDVYDDDGPGYADVSPVQTLHHVLARLHVPGGVAKVFVIDHEHSPKRTVYSVVKVPALEPVLEVLGLDLLACRCSRD